MWNVGCDGISLSMVEGDYGIVLPIVISGPTFNSEDSIELVIKRKVKGEVLLSKQFNPIINNRMNLVLSEEDSAKLSKGVYVYRLDWYQDGVFMYNIIKNARFKVVEKA